MSRRRVPAFSTPPVRPPSENIDQAIRYAVETSYLAGQILAEKDDETIRRVLDSWRKDAGARTEIGALSRLANAANTFSVLKEAVLLARKRLIDAGARSAH